jgi:tetratricopeptide (TPR) repeat protein/tRNA A-37 threonylcarbamoyl transferase component Bud32
MSQIPRLTRDELPGRAGPPLPTIPGYEIVGELARGGMGVVYKARQVQLRRIVALKMILTGAQASPEERLRFRAEAEAVARLQHPHIVQIHEVGEAEGRPYFSLEFCEGGSLADKLDGTPWPAKPAAQLTETLARAVHAAHERGIVHRDLKPANILLASGGREPPEESSSGGSRPPLAGYIPKVTDFGLAKHLDAEAGRTRTGAVLGTPSYMAPEQAAGNTSEVGPLSDQYALGAILYELLTGHPPFKAASVLATLEQVRTQEPVPLRRLQPTVPRDLETICLKCLHKEARKRYPTAAVLAEDLRRFLAGEPIQARPIGPLERLGRWCRRKPALAGVSAALLLVIAGGLAGMSWQWRRAEVSAHEARDQRDEAQRQRDEAEENFRLALDANASVGDLAEQLKSIAGTQSQTVDEILNLTARNYDRLLAEVGDRPAVLAGKAEMLNARADVYFDMNRTGPALTCADEALALFTQLAAQDLAASRYQAGLALSHDLRGRALLSQGQSSEALTAFRAGLTIRQGLTTAEPSNPEWQSALSSSHIWIGRLLELRGDRAGQQAGYQQALRLRAELVDAHPDNDKWRAELGFAHEKMGDFFFGTQPDAALKAYKQAASLYGTLVKKNPANTDWQRKLARVLTSIGQTYKAQGKLTEAEQFFQQSFQITERFSRLNPASVLWRSEYLRCRLHLAYLRKPADPAEEVKTLQDQLKTVSELLDAAEQLGRQDVANAEWRSQQAGLHAQIADLYWQLAEHPSLKAQRDQNFAAAQEALDRTLAILKPLAAQDPANVAWAGTLKGFSDYGAQLREARKKALP